jgi:hypothetical protein
VNTLHKGDDDDDDDDDTFMKGLYFYRCRYREFAADWTVSRSNPGGGEILFNCPDQPWGPPSLLYSEYRSLSQGAKRPMCGVNHPHPCRAEVKERVALYLCSRFGPA